MEIAVVIEPAGGSGFQARCGEPLPTSAEGTTREEALRNLQRSLAARLAGGVQVFPVQLPVAEHPWAKFVGMWQDDLYFDEWQATIAELRRHADEEPDVP